MATRKELAEAVGTRYQASTIEERSAILDEFVAITGYHRKHAIRLLSKPAAEPRKRQPRARYGTAVRETLCILWEVSDRVCSKRLKVMIPVLLPALIQHGKLADDAALQAQLGQISPATIDRLLAPVRLAAAKGRRRAAGKSSAIRRAVPIRTFGDWNDPVPGYVEVDFVAHCGPNLCGSFVQTLVLTDIATGWTECVPVLTRDGTLVIDAIAKARELFPFPLLGVDFDNDSVFMNERVVGWCRGQGLEVTRARAYRKNDQAWVEQKNGAIVRRLVGYGRFEGLESVQMLTRLYRASRLHTNLMQPSFKLKSKTRIGAQVVKQYHPPIPPAHRVLLHQAVSGEAKDALQQRLAAADPVLLFTEIRAAQAELGRRVDRRGLGRRNV
ncbi:integrase catalytic domain-containing protein [Azohydromonas lata]|uniref:Transposase family protein n=1 Tax=Azohydromonas lata TaxID=45677 RepID=A0ABU5I9S7_9BURK|nr:transposase family protein [Azohydromonas lata]MDZ5455863.1 transposase family protein [Azohydromonas lata]